MVHSLAQIIGLFILFYGMHSVFKPTVSFLSILRTTVVLVELLRQLWQNYKPPISCWIKHIILTRNLLKLHAPISLSFYLCAKHQYNAKVVRFFIYRFTLQIFHMHGSTCDVAKLSVSYMHIAAGSARWQLFICEHQVDAPATLYILYVRERPQLLLMRQWYCLTATER